MFAAHEHIPTAHGPVILSSTSYQCVSLSILSCRSYPTIRVCERGVRRLRRPPLSSYDNGNAASLQQRPSDEVAPVSSGKPLLLPPASPLQLQPSSPDLAGLVGAGRRQHASVAQLGRPLPAPFRLTMPSPPTPPITSYQPRGATTASPPALVRRPPLVRRLSGHPSKPDPLFLLPSATLVPRPTQPLKL